MKTKSPLKNNISPLEENSNQTSTDLKSGLTVEQMASHISQLKRPPLTFWCNPLGGNCLY